MFELVSEAPFTDGVAPGIDDDVAPVVDDKGTSGSLGKLSVFDFGDDIDPNFSVNAAIGGVVVFGLIPEAPFTDSVALGIDDGVASVVDDKGTSGSMGKLSVYNILAGLLPTNGIRISIREKRRKKPLPLLDTLEVYKRNQLVWSVTTQ